MKHYPAILIVVVGYFFINPSNAQFIYWDSNGAVAGSGVTPNGTWGLDTFWSTSSLGVVSTGAYTPNSDVVFSAGTDAVGSYTITLSGTQAANSITFEDGAPTITGGTLLQVGGGGINVTTVNSSGATIASALELTANQLWTVASGTSLTSSGIASGAFSLSKAGAGTLTLMGVNTFNGGLNINEGIVSGTTSSAAFGTGTITLGDASGSANATLSGGLAGTFANAISVASGNSGTSTITSSANTIFSGLVTLNHDLRLMTVNNNLTLSGGITGTGHLTLDATGGGAILLSTASVNNNGTITNSGTSATTNTISAGVGANVTAITENSPTSALTISGALTVNSGGTTLTNRNASGSALLTLSGGVTGTRDFILSNNSTISNGITISGSSVNNVGAIRNEGTKTGTALISAQVGSNVTSIVQNSATSEFFVTGALTVNSGGTTITNSNNATAFSLLTLSGGVTGTGNLLLNNNSGIANAITFSGTSVNNTGTIINSGTGTGVTRINSIIGNNVTGVIQDSATSQLTLAGVNTFSGGVLIKAGTVSSATSAAALGTGAITLGNTSGNSNVTLNGGFSGTHSNLISVTSGNTGLATISSSAASIFSGAVTLNSHDLRLSPGSSDLTLSGGITGTGNLTLNATSSGVAVISNLGVNNIGTITNSGAGSSTSTISGPVGSNVTAIIEDSTSSGLTISGGLTINSGGTTTLTNRNASGSSLLTLSGGVTGTGDLSLNNNSSITNGITLSTTSVNNSGVITNAGTGTGATRINAVIGTNVTSVIQNSATSQLTLGGINLFTGGLMIRAGTVSSVTSASAFGAGTINLGHTSGSADIALNGGFAGTYSNPISITSGNTGLATISSTANSIFNGLVTLNSHDLRLSPTADLTLSGGIVGAGNLSLLTGSGILTLSVNGVNNSGTITNSGAGGGATVISAGVGSNVTAITKNSSSSSFTVSGALTVNNAGTTITNANVSSFAAFTFSGGVTGTGDLLLVNNNNALSNGITFSTVSVNNVGALTNSGTGSATSLLSGGVGSNITTITENSTTSALTISGALAVNSGGTTLRNSNASGSSLLTLSGSITGTGNLLLRNDSAIANGITLAGANINNIGTITNSGGGNGSIRINGIVGTNVTGVVQNSASSQMTLAGANTYTGPTTVNAGTLNAGVASVANVSGAFGNNSAVTLANTSGATLSVSSFNTQIGSLAGGGGSGGNVVVTGAVLTLGGDNSNTSYGGVISGSGDLTKIGSGTQIFTGTNIYTGVTTLNAGTLSVGTIGNGGVAGNLGAASNNVANLVLGGGTLQYTGATASTNRRFTLTPGTISTFEVLNTVVTNLTFSGSSATTTGGLIKAGAGSLTFSGANTYTGSTIVNAGTLSAGIVSSANIYGAFGNNSAVTLANTSGATLNITGFNTQIGSLAGGGTNGGDVTLGAATLTTGGNNTDTAYAGTISGTGAFTKIGSGRQNLTGVNTYTGPTTVSAGTLLINGNNSAATGTVTVSSGAILGGSGIVGGATIVNGTHNPGNSPGLQTFTNGLAYNNGSIVNWELASNSIGIRGSNYDGIDVTGGDLMISGTATVNLNFNGTGSTVDWYDSFWGTSRQWTFYEVTNTITGMFTMGNVGPDSNGVYLYNVRTAFFDITYAGRDAIVSYTVIPEPHVWLLLLGAGAFLIVFRRRWHFQS